MARRQDTRRVPVALPETESAPERWLRTIRFSGFTFTALGLLILAVLVLAPSLKLLVEQQQEIAQLREARDQKQDAVDNLGEEVARWSDPAYIEAKARDRLLYVYPGEYAYLVIDNEESAASADPLPVSTSIQETQHDWVRSLVESVVTAGVTDKTADTLPSPTSTTKPKDGTG